MADVNRTFSLLRVSLDSRVAQMKLLKSDDWLFSGTFKKHKILIKYSRIHTSQLASPSLGSPDDTGSHEFANLVRNQRILHMIVDRARIALHLLKDGLHHGIGHQASYFGVRHCPLKGLLGRFIHRGLLAFQVTFCEMLLNLG